MFEKVGSRQLLSLSVQDQIELAIKERRLPPGEKLPTEMELCGNFGVSRTVMREALRMLSAKGLISIEKGRGMFVKEISADSVTDPMHMYLSVNYSQNYALDVVHARQAIEPSIAEMAAARCTEDVLRLLNENLQKIKDLKEDFTILASLDSEFHLLVAEASGNPIMPLVLEPIHKLMPHIKMAIYDVVENAKESAVEYHGKIVEAISRKNEHDARYWMLQHLKQAEEHIRRAIAEGKLASGNRD
jgi:GntR family transcriptional regulator, transcriptional repressor for pyruvate dehydrogenase complex